MLHRRWEQVREKHRYSAEHKRRPDTDGDQREHVQVKRYDGTPAALKERPASPANDGDREYKLNPA